MNMISDIEFQPHLKKQSMEKNVYVALIYKNLMITTLQKDRCPLTST